MQNAIFIAEKNYIIENTQPVYERIKSSLPYRIVGFFPLAGHVMEFNEPNDTQFSWQKIPYLPQNIVTYDWDNVTQAKGMQLYRPSRKVMGGKHGYERVNAIADFLNKHHVDFIISAGDSDREGSLLLLEVLNYLGIPLTATKRYWIKGGFTDPKVEHSLRNLLDLDYTFSDGNKIKYMYQASELRSQIDRVMGYSYSPALSLKTQSRIRAGRIKLPAVKLVVDRDLEIKNFVPETYYDIQQKFSVDDKSYVGKLLEGDTKKTAYITDKSKMEQIKKDLANPTAKIISLESRKSAVRPPQFLHTNDVKKQFLKKYGNKQIEDAMESLYHKRKIMTYPRTDTRYVSGDDATTFPDLLKAAQSIPSLKKAIQGIPASQISKISKDKRFVDSKKAGAHEALVPTEKSFDFNSLTKIEQEIISYVDGFFVQAFLPDQILLKTDIITQNGQHRFISRGQIEQDPGWTKLLGKTANNKILPQLNNGQQVTAHPPMIKTGQTTPPPHYTLSTLQGAMGNVASLVSDKDAKKILRETKGLGTDTSQGAIVDGLIASGQLLLHGKTVTASEGSIKMIEALQGLDIIDPISTANFETKLAMVSKGEIKASDYQKQAFDYVTQQCEIIKNSSSIPTLGAEAKDTGMTHNGAKIYLIKGQYGPYYTVALASGKNAFISQKLRGMEITLSVLGELLQNGAAKVKSTTGAVYDITFNDQQGFAMSEENTATGLTYKGKAVTKHQGQYGPYYQIPHGKKYIFVSENVGGAIITPEVLQKMLDGEAFKDQNVKFKSGTYKVDISIDFKQNKLAYTFSDSRDNKDSGEKAKTGEIEICKGKYGKYYKSGKYNIGAKWSSHVWTLDEVKALFNGESVHVKFTAKSGKEMETDLKYDKRKKKVVFVE